ncbi:hypothetical protein Taro_004861 [Colocasia esculenta]|uniref:Uncharacterized protein n=1 Tax=Colocasia esculenta TaxID=4460 RepID=A0A843TW71_COLES|nr:hypothetical protein [Colocasia esculenta]
MAEAQPASGLRRRHRPCHLQEGDVCPVALPVRRRHRGFRAFFFREPPRNEENTTHGGGEHAYHARKPLNIQTTLKYPKNMDSTLGGNLTHTSMEFSHSQPRTTRKLRHEGEGEHA